jgi:hypothetical protein
MDDQFVLPEKPQLHFDYSFCLYVTNFLGQLLLLNVSRINEGCISAVSKTPYILDTLSNLDHNVHSTINEEENTTSPKKLITSSKF